MRIIFLISFLLFFAGYVFWKFVSLFPQNRWMVVLGVSVFVFLSISWLFVARSNMELINHTWLKTWVWLGSLSMGLLGTFIMFSLFVDALKIFELIFRKTIPFDEERRNFAFQALSYTAAGTAVVTTGLGFKSALEGPEIKSVMVPIQNWKDSLKDLVIAQISDLHVGLTIDRSYVENVAKKTMELKPDLIMITGDLVDGDPETLKDRWEPLRQLQAPLGVFFVTGNHEYYSGVERWLATVRQMGFIPLVNEFKEVKYKDATVLISGVTDVSGGEFAPEHKPNYEKARGSQNSDLKILLAHRPEASDEAEKLGYDLQLSGHTHAGQFFPFNLVVQFAHRHVQGLSRQGNLQVYVNQGTGYWGPAHRFMIPSEITKIQFKSTKES